jgi:trimeric autotransporter adhesin
MKQAIWIAPFAALLLAGCGSDGDGGDADTPGTRVAVRNVAVGDATCAGGGQVAETGVDRNGNGSLEPSEVTQQEYLQCLTAPRLRALHASPDAPPVNIRVNGAQALSAVDYAQGSAFLPVAATSRVEVEAIIPGGNAVVIDENLSLQFSTDYTVIAVGQVAAPVGPLLLSNPTVAPIAAGNLRAQVVHAAPGAPAVDVYVTAPGASLAASSAVNETPLAYREFTGRAELAAGNYQIRVTPAGDRGTVVYDSGTLSLPAAADLLVVAVANTGPGESPIQLVALDGQGANVLRDVATPASVVAVHASSDAPAVDLLADDKSTSAIETLVLARNVAFPAACRIPAVPAPGSYALSVTAAGNPSVVALQFDLAPRKADVVTAIVTGYLAGTPALRPLALSTNERSVVTEARLRVTHASPGTGAVDLYLLADGASLATATPSFAAVPFGADTGQLSIAPGVYDVYVTPAGNRAVVAIEVQNLSLSGGEVLDVIARDARTNGSEGALPQLIVVDHAQVANCPS